MKKSVLIFVTLFLLGSSLLFSQEEINVDVIIEDAMKDVEKAMEEIEAKKITIKMDFSSNGPKMGVYLSDLDFKDIYEMHYNYNYGVLITGIVPGGPSHKAGLIKGDIVMEFDGLKVKYEDHLVRLMKSKNMGDEVIVKVFRDENILETTLVLETLGKKPEKAITFVEGVKKKKFDVGNGGGSWYPIWYMPDVEEINEILSGLEFQDETFSEDGFLIQGGGGQGNVGKGWFIGGMGAGYSNKETTKHDWPHYKNGVYDTTTVSRKAEYYVNFWGVTLDKRFAMSEKFIGSYGFMIGGGQNAVKISQTDDNGEVNNFDFDSGLNEQMDSQYDFKSKLLMEQDFIIFQPKVMFMYHILDWLGIRVEAGYILSYSLGGWKGKRNGESVKLVNAPEAKMDGLTLCIGPWFGF